MLTILVKCADGTETLCEADSIVLENLPNPPTTGVKFFSVFASPNTNCPETIMLANPGDALFVMNRHGTTVAKYRHEHPGIGVAADLHEMAAADKVRPEFGLASPLPKAKIPVQ